MKLPHSVKKSTYLAYNSQKHVREERKVLPEMFDCDFYQAKPLVTLCIEKLAENWKG